MPADIRLISHCYAEADRRYAGMLSQQLASLIRWQPRCHAEIVVVHTTRDVDTVAVLDIAERNMPARGTVSLIRMALPTGMVLRRCIGRHRATVESDARMIWYTDADYLFGPGALDSACELGDDPPLRYPRDVFIHASHAIGDAACSSALAELDGGKLALPNLADFAVRPERKAIGGIQIVNGDLARRIGYLDIPGWREPAPDDAGFQPCACDVRWRKVNDLGSGTPAYIPQVYRCRHTGTGIKKALA